MQRRATHAPVGRLATVTPAGTPHVVPVCFVLVGSRIFTATDGKPKTTRALQRFDNVRANPSASLLVDHWDDDWSQLWWVRADGPAHVVEEGPELDDGIEALREKYRGHYGIAPPTGPGIVLDATHWVGWAARP